MQLSRLLFGVFFIVIIVTSSEEIRAWTDIKETRMATPEASDKKLSVFMKCVRGDQKTDTSNSGYWYFDVSKKRSLTYGVELRMTGEQPKPATVILKTFFVGSVNNNRDTVVDKKEENVVLEPGKVSRISLQSKEVEEYTQYYYYYSGSRKSSSAKLKGVIIQVWDGDEIISTFVSSSQWNKFSESPDVAKQMGELKEKK